MAQTIFLWCAYMFYPKPASSMDRASSSKFSKLQSLRSRFDQSGFYVSPILEKTKEISLKFWKKHKKWRLKIRKPEHRNVSSILQTKRLRQICDHFKTCIHQYLNWFELSTQEIPLSRTRLDTLFSGLRQPREIPRLLHTLHGPKETTNTGPARQTRGNSNQSRVWRPFPTHSWVLQEFFRRRNRI